MTMVDRIKDDRLMTPTEVAKIFRVDPKTVTRWAKVGKLPFIRTIGGHRRYWESDVNRLMEKDASEQEISDGEKGEA